MLGTLSANSSRVSAGGHASNANRRATALSLSSSLSLSLSLSLSVPGSQKSDERDGEDIPDAPDGAFRSEPPDVYIRPQNSSRHAALLPLYGNSHDYAISALV